MPERFQWALAVTREPPAAEGNLDGKYQQAYRQACGIAAVGRKVQSESKIYECSENRLRYVVGETIFP